MQSDIQRGFTRQRRELHRRGGGASRTVQVEIADQHVAPHTVGVLPKLQLRPIVELVALDEDRSREVWSARMAELAPEPD